MESATCWEFIECIKSLAAPPCRTFLYLGPGLPFWLLHPTGTILLTSTSVAKPFMTAWERGLLIRTTPSHPNCSSGPPAHFQGLYLYYFYCKKKKVLAFFLEKKCYYCPRITYIFKWLKCENIHFSARPQTHCFNVFLMTFQSVNHYIPSAMANGGCFLLGRRFK